MAIIQALIAALARFAGKILNTLFGWATTTLYGRVPQEKQTLLSLMSLGSVVWIVLLIGVIWPEAGVFLLSFATLPAWVEDHWVRLAMLAAVVIVPAGIGLLSTRVTGEEDQPHGFKATLKRILQGYPYTVATSLALILMIVFVPLLKIRTLAKRWTTEHLAMVVDNQDYMKVVADIRQALEKFGIQVAPAQASFLLRLPIKVLTSFAGKTKSRLVSEQLTTLSSDQVELILHPSDLVISGDKHVVTRVRAVVSEQLAFSPVYLTWTKEANEIEDRLGELWRKLRSQNAVHGHATLSLQIQQIENDLRSAKITSEEWEILLREKLLVERGILQMAAGLVDKARTPAEMNAQSLGTGALLSDATPPAKAVLYQAMVFAGAILGLWLGGSKIARN